MTDPFIGMDAGFEDARRQLQEIRSQAQNNKLRADALADDADSITAEARSAHGEVTVRAGVGGRVRLISFGVEAERLPLDALGHLTTQTVAEAQHSAMVRLADRGAELFGAESDIALSLRRDADRGYPRSGTSFS
ncbi:hypothetical protein [Microbacterium sp. SORGH_AS_0888]|uniref:hypothetical protein n=1 Tax=Microbacterium sp. SORGH_AS_0888 TaxID=3041791 RepID=UPI0027891113|nr:hypothetical protein [Microbacterium sp. SORGH_AS_0888]MDQ1128822.1 hypothetical protein [Microbacterium sp. SORGH_AS_0888]